LGIIFGDIGTSPLYVLNTIFDSQPSKKQCIGAISLIIWDLIIIVSIKYGIFILMADNDGEGGTFALCALLTGENSQLGRRAKIGMTVVALAAASLLIGDGALTPAVSVLSAVQGLAVQAPDLQVWIVPITVVILVLLFIAQRWGTSKIGITFGPIMCIWFLSLFLIGIWQITLNPTILKAFDPWEALEFLTEEKQTALYRTSGVFLAVTGLEALYAGLGHFGRWPVRCSWFCIVFPGVLINYLGQGALLITDPSLIDNPFYHSVPKWAHWPMIVLSTVATIIASQAIITGSFSLISQAVGLKCSVPFQIVHTSKKIIGQIYVPGITYILMLLTITVTIASRTTSALKNAYGVTVCSVMIITTVLYMCVMRYTWQKPWYLVLAFGLFLIIDSYTLAANAIKIPAGGWIAIVIATGFFILGFCWFFGELNLHRFLKTHVRPTNLHTLSARLGFLNNNTHQNHQYSFADLPLMQTVDQIDFGNESDSNSDSDIDYQANKSRILPKVQNRVLLIKSVPRVSPNNIPSPFGRTDENTHGTIPVVITPCVGCFLTTSKKHTPHLFENFLAYMHAVPEVIIFLQIEHTKRPTIESNNRVIVKTYGKNIFHITALYGYSEYQITPFEILSLARTQYNVPIPNDEKKMTLFLPHETIKVSTTGWHSWIRRWPLYVYSVLKSLYPGASTNINVKMENTVSIGIVAKL
jgi:potassium uptake protein